LNHGVISLLAKLKKSRKVAYRGIDRLHPFSERKTSMDLFMRKMVRGRREGNFYSCFSQYWQNSV
jgi:hypothetical protein